MDWLTPLYKISLSALKIVGLFYVLTLIFSGAYFFATNILGIDENSAVTDMWFLGILGCIAIGVLQYEDKYGK
ncbi:MAG TPA: hypothetical protein PK109_00090 [Candidatus Paceibacterota bacterium]|nr:hypothetical protein [Candidatus Paceibacterota bacterium]